ncbi:hypothetical protein QTP88_004731 [Uroleucon formosanum]
MSSRQRDKYRKFDSGHQKRLRKLKLEQNLEKQRGALDQFVFSSNIPEIVQNETENYEDELMLCDIEQPCCSKELVTQNSIEVVEKDNSLTFNNKIVNKTKEDELMLSDIEQPCCSKEFVTQNSIEVVEKDSSLTFNKKIVNKNKEGRIDFRDPAQWPQLLTHDMRVEIVLSKSEKIEFYENYSKNEQKRKFSNKLYYRIMKNSEKIARNWLLYSKSHDRVYCFCCKLFSSQLKIPNPGSLTDNGTSDWKHIALKLEQHENSSSHKQTILSWNELQTRIIQNETIDDLHLKEIDKEKQYWKDVLKRILSAIFYLAKHGDAFRGSSDVIYTEHNGKFLGLIEMMAKFYPVIQEHVRRIKNGETHDHYLGHQIQDELIELIAQQIRQQIVEDIKEAKYFSIMMDCTPDVSKEEQLSIIIRILDMGNKSMSTIPCIKEYFIEFINVHSTTGYDLTNILLNKLNRIGIDLKDCRGQAYDNGANMKGQYKGVQSRIIAKNPRAYFSPCACHNLNLLLGDIAKSSTVAVGFFGTIQRIYCLFASSTKRWESYEFILSLIIWYEVLVEVNTVSKTLQNINIHLDKCSNLLNGLIQILKSFRMNGFESSKIKANEISDVLNIDKTFKKKRIRKTKKQFDYENSDEINDDPENNFRTFYFNVIAD